MSLAVASGGASASTTGAVADIPFQNAAPQVFTLGEEEITDVSLSTFYVFDKENSAIPRLNEKLAWRCGGCGRCGHGCGRGCGRCGCGCGLQYCGGCGCGGCCISWGKCRWAC
jgi:hypothetical protein